MTGEIRDFSKPAEKPQEPTQPVQILSQAELTKQEGVEVQVRRHEEVIVPADKLRHKPIQPGDPEIRIRAAVDKEAWERVKRGEDE